MSERLDVYEDMSNPLDCVEEVLSGNDWNFDRAHEDELRVQVDGKMGSYGLSFIWQEEFSAMEFVCEYGDVIITKKTLDLAAKTLSAINATLWLGHFDLKDEINIPQFRHTSLLRGMNGSSGAELVEDLVDIALAECERYHPVFEILSKNDTMDDTKSLMLAMMDTAGES